MKLKLYLSVFFVVFAIAMLIVAAWRVRDRPRIVETPAPAQADRAGDLPPDRSPGMLLSGSDPSEATAALSMLQSDVEQVAREVRGLPDSAQLASETRDAVALYMFGDAGAFADYLASRRIQPPANATPATIHAM